MKRKSLITILAFLFTVTPLLGAAQKANASDGGNIEHNKVVQENENDEGNDAKQTDNDQDVASAADMKALVEQLADKGEFKNDQAVHALTLHLTAVSHYEKQDKKDKVIKHMKGFKVLLNHQKANGLISDSAYDTLKENADALIKKLNSLAIVVDGQAHAVILVPEDENEQVKAADVLAKYVQKSTGVELPVMTKKEWQEKKEEFADDVRIYVGNRAPGDDAHIEAGLENLNDQGFLIYPHGNHVTIVGPTVVGTLNGVYEFLERYVDVRWLLQGSAWEDVPQLTDVTVPLEDVREEPAFEHRVISAGLAGTGWLEENKLQIGDSRPIQFQEHLYSLFPVEKYGKTHPEFYPGGNPPDPGVYHTWQPCFTAEGSVDAAVSGLLDYFDQHPEATSYSLGINDSTNFCETDPDNPHYPDKTNSAGYIDMSDIYYKWINEVVEQVLEVYPDKWFGLLAYNNVTDPPSFKLNSRVVPFITKDRMTWIDDDTREVGHKQMDEWNKVASQIGWYDYMYGTFYVAPRVYPHQMAKIYQYANKNHVYGFYTEMYHNVGDGPKAWISAKLQWDPDQDVDALLQEWYERAVGKLAAPDLAAYYDLWEQFWTERIKDSPWFQAGKRGTYLPFKDASYLSLVTEEDIAESKRLLTSVVAKAQTDSEKKRAKQLLRMFEYYEDSALSYPHKVDPPEGETDALAMLDSMANGVQLAQKRHDLIDEFEEVPALKFHVMPRVDWSGWNSYEFWPLLDYLSDKEPEGGTVTDRIHELANGNGSSNQRDVARLLEGMKTGELNSLTENPSFEEGKEDAPPWNFWNPVGTSHIKRVEGSAHTGNGSVLFENTTDRAGTYETFAIHSGLTAARVHYYTPPGTETQGTVRIVMSLLDANGKTLGDYISTKTPLANTAGEWSSVGLLEDIPAGIENEKVAKVLVNAQVYNAPDAQVYMDDVVVYQNESSNEDQQILTENSSFEIRNKSTPPWGYWIKDTGSIERVEDKAHTGEASLLVSHMERGGPSQTFDVQPGSTKAQVYYYSPSDTTEGTIQLVLHAKNDQRAKLVSFQTDKVPLSSSAGKWSSLELSEEIPASVDGQEVTTAQIVAVIDGAEDTQVYLDDLEVRRQDNDK